MPTLQRVFIEGQFRSIVFCRPCPVRAWVQRTFQGVGAFCCVVNRTSQFSLGPVFCATFACDADMLRHDFRQASLFLQRKGTKWCCCVLASCCCPKFERRLNFKCPFCGRIISALAWNREMKQEIWDHGARDPCMVLVTQHSHVPWTILFWSRPPCASGSVYAPPPTFSPVGRLDSKVGPAHVTGFNIFAPQLGVWGRALRASHALHRSICKLSGVWCTDDFIRKHTGQGISGGEIGCDWAPMHVSRFQVQHESTRHQKTAKALWAPDNFRLNLKQPWFPWFQEQRKIKPEVMKT